jgi:hypothetical protein
MPKVPRVPKMKNRKDKKLKHIRTERRKGTDEKKMKNAKAVASPSLVVN